MDWLFQGAPEISYETFASRALFHPEKGYYSHSIPTVGADGDFSTSATLSDLLGRAIADWIASRDQLLPVIEIGAGDGSLAQSVHQSLPFLAKLRFDLHIVETSPVLRQQQQSKAPRRTTWHNSLADALIAVGGKAHIYSNELVDAFPPRVFQLGETIKELFVDQSFTEVWRNCENLPDSSVFQLTSGVVEVLQSFQDYLKAATGHWSYGEMFTIDYGDVVAPLYHRRPLGSRRAYFHHQLLEGAELYHNPGNQDLTCDVNFTDLIHWGESLGLELVSFSTQSKLLRKHARGTTVDEYLLHPDGPGSAFKVLHQRRI